MYGKLQVRYFFSGGSLFILLFLRLFDVLAQIVHNQIEPVDVQAVEWNAARDTDELVDKVNLGPERHKRHAPQHVPERHDGDYTDEEEDTEADDGVVHVHFRVLQLERQQGPSDVHERRGELAEQAVQCKIGEHVLILEKDQTPNNSITSQPKQKHSYYACKKADQRDSMVNHERKLENLLLVYQH